MILQHVNYVTQKDLKQILRLWLELSSNNWDLYIALCLMIYLKKEYG